MRDAAWVTWLARRLPQEVFEDAFVPALADRRAASLRHLASAGWMGRSGASFRYNLAVLVLILQCWRLARGEARTSLRAATAVDHTRTGSPGHHRQREHFVMNLGYQLRHAARLLRTQPLFTTATVLTLALGVGANVAVFAVVEAVLLRPLPYPAADELAVLKHRDERTGIEKEFIAIGDFIDLAARQQVFATFFPYSSGSETITGQGDPIRVDALSAGPDLLPTIGATAVRGRLLSETDAREGAAPVVVLGHQLWTTSFAADEGIVGRRIRIGQTDREIVGVASPGLRFPATRAREVGIVVPIVLPAAAPAERKSGWVFAAGRLSPGIDAARATANLRTLSEQMEGEFPVSNQGSRYFATPLADTVVGDTKRPLFLLLGAVGVVLLIACANVGNLLLARALGRRQEMAVRMALGAGRARLVGQLVAESLVLSALAGLVGIAAARWAVVALVSLVPPSVTAPGLADVGINGGVLAFTVGVTILTAVIFSALTALTVRADGGGEALVAPGRVSSSQAGRRAAAALVTAEVALAVMLLIGAGLILRSFSNLLTADPGFQTSGVLTVDIALPAERYAAVESRSAFYERAFAALRDRNGLVAAGAGVVTPLTGNNWTVPFERADRPVPAGQRPPDVGWQSASGGFFDALTMPVRSGRVFATSDRAPAPRVVIVSESIERQFFPGETAVGHRVRVGDADAEIVGVVGDIRRASLTDEPRPDMYFPFERSPGTATTLFLRTAGDAAAIAPAVRQTLRDLEPQIVLGTTTTLDRVRADSVAGTTFALSLLGLFAVIALALAAVGVYGVMAYVVRQRTREIGTRLALGATRQDIVWLIVRQGGTMAAVGLAAGLLTSWLAAESLAAMLYDVSVTDPSTFGGSVGVVALTAVLACYVPARRAARLDASRALRRA